jgi:uncharacterized protein YbjT (DUF2867 family)
MKMPEDSVRIAVVGATGQVGFPLAQSLTNAGHDVTAISRIRTAQNGRKLDLLTDAGVSLAFCEDYTDTDAMIEIFQGHDTVVVATRMNTAIAGEVGGHIIDAAAAAGVTRFVPDEFGTHTLALEYGCGTLFDVKKKTQERVIASGMNYTLMFTGGFFDYFLPNLRLFDRITTFGDLSIQFATHDISDIAEISARSVVDSRTVNKAVQIHGNVVTQTEVVEILRDCWPDYGFEYEHVTTEDIIYQKEHADPKLVSAKGGAEPDRERAGINYTIWVLGRLSAPNHENTLNASHLFPDYVYKKPEDVLCDRNFVFGDK